MDLGTRRVERCPVVTKELRSAGSGCALLHASEAEAITRGCLQIALATHTFQARGFYERHNYEVVGYLDQYPAGQGQHFMRKILG